MQTQNHAQTNIFGLYKTVSCSAIQKTRLSTLISYLGCGYWCTVGGWCCPAGWVSPCPPPEPPLCSHPPPPCLHTPTGPLTPVQTPEGKENLHFHHLLANVFAVRSIYLKLFLETGNMFLSSLNVVRCPYLSNKSEYLTMSLVGSSILWDVALTLSGEAPPSCSWEVTASVALSVALCSLMASLKPDMDTSSAKHIRIRNLDLTLHLWLWRTILSFSSMLPPSVWNSCSSKRYKSTN